MLQWNTTSWKTTNDWKELHCQEPTPPIQRYTKAHQSLWISQLFLDTQSVKWTVLVLEPTNQTTYPSSKTPLPERPEEWGPLPSWQAQHANTTHKDKSDNSNDKDEHGNNEDNAESWKWRTATTSTTTTQKPTTTTSHLLPPNLPNEYRYRTQNYGSTILKCVKW